MLGISISCSSLLDGPLCFYSKFTLIGEALLSINGCVRSQQQNITLYMSTLLRYLKIIYIYGTYCVMQVYLVAFVILYNLYKQTLTVYVELNTP